MKNTILILAVLILASCTTQKGFNYSAHHRKTKAAMRKAHVRNNGNDLINWKCTNNH
jgi:hypothetical protein